MKELAFSCLGNFSRILKAVFRQFRMHKFSGSTFAIATIFAFTALHASAQGVWRGTAPFCDGKCEKNERQIGVSDSGDGGYCVTGHKVLCASNNDKGCAALQTRTSCYGVVMVCDNGHYLSLNQNWQSCDKFACGACLGLSLESLHLNNLQTQSFTPDACQEGLVWREATKDDHVCVPPATRTAAAMDNANASAHVSKTGGAYGADTCLPGFVWRAATPSDHVCVTPQRRDETAADNAKAAEHRAPPHPYGSDTCKQGYVWREAIRNDHVCVPPATRAEAAADNASAAARKSKNGGVSGPDTCVSGFVWREVIPSDHVCVPPQHRATVAADNSMADQRVTR